MYQAQIDLRDADDCGPQVGVRDAEIKKNKRKSKMENTVTKDDFEYTGDFANPSWGSSIEKIKNAIEHMYAETAGMFKYMDQEYECSEGEYEAIEKIIDDLKTLAWMD
jgi:hypothetical protein